MNVIFERIDFVIQKIGEMLLLIHV